MATECTPWWATTADSNCPYGSAIPSPFEVTITKPYTFAKALAIIYSLIPYAVVLANIIELVVKRGSRQVSFLMFSGTITLLNEFIVKRLFDQPRPGASGKLMDEDGLQVGSCLRTCGMPSSHAAMSIGFLVLLICDGIYRVVPSKDELEIGIDKSFRFKCRAELARVWITSTPLSPLRLMTHKEFVCFFLVWAILLAPVSISRVALYDHSTDQVMLGGTVGFVCGVSWFGLMQQLTRRWSQSLGHSVCYGMLKHDYRPAEFRIKLHDQPEIINNVIFKGAEIVMPTDEDIRGSLVVQMAEMGPSSLAVRTASLAGGSNGSSSLTSAFETPSASLTSASLTHVDATPRDDSQ